MKFPDQFRRKDARLPDDFRTNDGDPYGAFYVPGPKANGRALAIIACDGTETGWEHVSVSLPDSPTKCPSWDEMCIVKNLFWDTTEAVCQFHPPESEYVNRHQGCLHLWRCVGQPFPLPPKIYV